MLNPQSEIHNPQYFSSSRAGDLFGGFGEDGKSATVGFVEQLRCKDL